MVRVRDIIKFGRVNFKLSALECDYVDPIYNGTCYKPPAKRTARKGKSFQDHSVEALNAANNLTEMNIVNDVTGTHSMMM